MNRFVCVIILQFKNKCIYNQEGSFCGLLDACEVILGLVNSVHETRPRTLP